MQVYARIASPVLGTQGITFWSALDDVPLGKLGAKILQFHNLPLFAYGQPWDLGELIWSVVKRACRGNDDVTAGEDVAAPGGIGNDDVTAGEDVAAPGGIGNDDVTAGEDVAAPGGIGNDDVIAGEDVAAPGNGLSWSNSRLK